MRPVKTDNIPFGASYNASLEQRENAVGLRLTAARKQAGLTLSALASMLRGCGVSVTPQAVCKWESGKSVPNAYQLLALSRLLELPADEFCSARASASALNDDGRRKLEQYRQDLIASGRYAPAVETKVLEMPVFDRPASAGTGSFLDGDSFRTETFPAETVPAKADFAVYVTGDSMLPYYVPGQLVWVQACKALRPGEVGIFVVDGESFIKQYTEQLPEDADSYTDSDGAVHPQTVLVSYNSRYAPRVITPEMRCTVVGRVLR